MSQIASACQGVWVWPVLDGGGISGFSTLDSLYAFLTAFQGVGCVHVHVWCESVLDRLLGPFTAVLRVGGVWVCAGCATRMAKEPGDSEGCMTLAALAARC